MKARIAVLGLFSLSMLVFNNSVAQKATITTPGGISIGLGAGYAYQKSDLANSGGLGSDFTIGSRIFHRQNAFLGVDWKFRFLAGSNKAYDHRVNPDGTFSNIRYSFFSYDLELGLTLNRLRERTGIILTGFAGAGITHGRTFTDLYDAGDNLYDYGTIDPNRESKAVYRDLVALSDGDFETRLVNRAAFLPTAGLFIGYQLSRSVALGIEFKTNFYLNEENSFAGIDLDNRVISGSRMDRNNYASLGFRWNLGGGSSSGRSVNNNRDGETNNYSGSATGDNLVVAASPSRPSVEITDPSAGSIHTGTPFHTIKATINHVSGPDNISFLQNGFPNNSFTYNAATNAFVASVRLREGENSFRIKATNQLSTAEAQAIITLDKPLEEVVAAPSVRFTSPSEARITSSSDRLEVTASVKYITGKEGIQLTLNGSDTPFEYYPVSGSVRTSVLLKTGDNMLLISGSNESGSAQDELVIHKNLPEEMAIPTVRFIDPAIPVEVVSNRFPLRAEIQNVHGQNDVTVRFNGSTLYNFQFDAQGMVSASLVLLEGVNSLEITARNEAGFASESTAITFRRPVINEPVYNNPVNYNPVYNNPVNNNPVYNNPVTYNPSSRISPPVINILNPPSNQLRTYQPSEEVRATVLNVRDKESITLHMNGSSIQNFNFNNSTKLLTATIALREGENLLTIAAQNESGGDARELVLMKETRPCRQPVIRLIEPVEGQSSTDQQTYAIRAEVRNAHSGQLRLTANGNPLSFSLSNNMLSAQVPLVGGLNTLSLSATNECGADQVSARISYVQPAVTAPCNPPAVSFALRAVNRNNATHELRGTVSGVTNKADIALILDGRSQSVFQFAPASGVLSAAFKLDPGPHTVVVSAKNTCGTDSRSESVTFQEVKDEPCGIRFNPGNADWQFCLVTPSGTFTRENLTNANFSYSGPARSLYFLPTGGGGTATVNGGPYAVRSGQYYLFTGSLNVNISTRNPGSMGQWSVCITAGSAPVSGNGNNRPKSPCEGENEEGAKGRGNKR